MGNNILLNKDIFWVGKVDDRDVPFHRLMLTKGTTYNSYLLMTEKPTIIDTVDMKFAREFVENLKNIIDLEKIAYIVINHTEPDHSGALGSLVTFAKNAVIVCSKLAVIELKEMYKLHNRDFLVVGDGDTLDIGGKTLRFIETPYLHTAETMVTYCVDDKILFSCDIFSTHIANYEYFNDSAKEDIKNDYIGYYNLIIHPHRRYAQNMIQKIKLLDIQMIAPSHGFILRKDVKSYIDIYDTMSKNTETSKRALVLYTSMTGRTKKIASFIVGKFQEQNIVSEAIDINIAPIEEVLNAISEANVIFFGTSTKYADMIGNMEDLLKILNTINLEDKFGAVFGSYGWSGEAIEVVQDYLKRTNIKLLNTSDIIKGTGMIDVQLPIRIRFTPNEDDLKNIERAVIYTTDLLLSTI